MPQSGEGARKGLGLMGAGHCKLAGSRRKCKGAGAAEPDALQPPLSPAASFRPHSHAPAPPGPPALSLALMPPSHIHPNVPSRPSSPLPGPPASLRSPVFPPGPLLPWPLSSTLSHPGPCNLFTGSKGPASPSLLQDRAAHLMNPSGDQLGC